MVRFAFLAVVLLASSAHAACPGYSKCPLINYPYVMKHNPEVLRALARIDAHEAATLQILKGRLRFGDLVARLGEAMVFDKSLSVRKNEACAFCHDPAAGFAGGLAVFARAGGIIPGSVTWRTGPRPPQSLAYAAFAPPLTIKADGTFVGGNFRDGRATGAVTGSPAVDQALMALTDPTEMALPDLACVVRRVIKAPYGRLFRNVWGNEISAIHWPSDTSSVCAQPAGQVTAFSRLQLTASNRQIVINAATQIGQTIVTFESSALVSSFTSKFDDVEAGLASFSPQEAAGYNLFLGKAQCSVCHAATGKHPLFTDFSFHKTCDIRYTFTPYLNENVTDQSGFVANPAGASYHDFGLGGSTALIEAFQGQKQLYNGAFQVPTLRNVAALPSGGMRTFMHDGRTSGALFSLMLIDAHERSLHCAASENSLKGLQSSHVHSVDGAIVGNRGIESPGDDIFAAPGAMKGSEATQVAPIRGRIDRTAQVSEKEALEISAFLTTLSDKREPSKSDKPQGSQY